MTDSWWAIVIVNSTSSCLTTDGENESFRCWLTNAIVDGWHGNREAFDACWDTDIGAVKGYAVAENHRR